MPKFSRVNSPITDWQLPVSLKIHFIFPKTKISKGQTSKLAFVSFDFSPDKQWFRNRFICQSVSKAG